MEKVSSKKLKRLINNHKVISFDVFDTLIKRNCYHPTDIFEFVEKIYNNNHEDKINDFKKTRIQCEQKAREKYNNFEDITLKEIYDELNVEKSIRQELMEIEIKMEQSFCQKNHNIYNIYEYCKKHNKFIICTSDMYLDIDIIKKILINEGYDIDKIYLSSQLRKTKVSGNIFKYIIEDLNISKKDILHIGDNWKADYIRPKMLGITAYHINRNEINFSYLKKSDLNYKNLNNNLIFSLINNNCTKLDNMYQKFGYEIVGPMCLEFCYWLKRKADEEGIDNLLFCARDMKLIQEIFNLFFNKSINNSYFYVSRRSTYLPYLYKNNNYECFKSLIPPGKRKVTIGELLDLYNIKINPSTLNEKLKLFGLDNKEKYVLEEIKNKDLLIQYYEKELKKVIDKLGKTQYKNFTNYLKTIGYDDHTALVDLGWRGTTQNIMIEILNKPLYGYYVGLNSLNGKELKNNYDTFLYFGQDNLYAKKVYSFMSLFELILSALHGSTIGYSDNANSPFLLDKSVNNNNVAIIEIQNGALLFCQSIFKYKNMLDFSHDRLFVKQFITVGTNPTLEQAHELGSIYTENIKVRKLCNYQKFSFYIFHLKEFKQDFMDSEWKIGFLKNVFKINLPYYKIYRLLKSIDKK